MLLIPKKNTPQCHTSLKLEVLVICRVREGAAQLHGDGFAALLQRGGSCAIVGCCCRGTCDGCVDGAWCVREPAAEALRWCRWRCCCCCCCSALAGGDVRHVGTRGSSLNPIRSRSVQYVILGRVNNRGEVLLLLLLRLLIIIISLLMMRRGSATAHCYCWAEVRVERRGLNGG